MEFEEILKAHSAEALILTTLIIVVGTLLVALPQLLRANLRKAEWWHEERLKAIEKGLPMQPDDDRSRLAGRIALLVPMVVMLSASIVTSFMVVYKSQEVFSVALAVWVVAGVVSLAAITGGVALMGRIALLQAGEPDEEQNDEEEPHETSYMK